MFFVFAFCGVGGGPEEWPWTELNGNIIVIFFSFSSSSHNIITNSKNMGLTTSARVEVEYLSLLFLVSG